LPLTMRLFVVACPIHLLQETYILHRGVIIVHTDFIIFP
jgi:hypothetical protein